MTRVLHVYSGNLFGGVEALLRTLAEASHAGAAIHSEYALCFDGRLRRELEQRGASVHALGAVRLRRPLGVIRAARRLRRVIERGDYDMVICHSVWALALFGRSVRRAGVPLGFWLHDVATGRHWLERLARLSTPDLVIANSHFTAASVRFLFPALKPLVLHCPVPEPRRWLPSERLAVRAEMGTAAGALVLVQVGRMDPLKGHEVLIDACARLAADARWECWLVGGAQRPEEESYVSMLRARVDASGLASRFRFLGERADVARLLTGADILVQPNVRPEAFGIAVVEAMYAGLPVVASRLGGAVESLAEGGGVLVVPNDPDALARELETLLADPAARARRGGEGRRRAPALCDPLQQLRTLEAAVSPLARHVEASRPEAATDAASATGGIPISPAGMTRQ